MNLSPSQLHAVVSPSVNRLVIAGPGSGKTHTTVEAIVRDMAFATKEEDPNPCSRAIVVTFTVKAAEEIRDRLANRGIVPYHVGTLHSLCAKIVSSVLGYRIAVLDQNASEAAIQSLIDSLRAKVTVNAVRQAIRGEASSTAAQALVAPYQKLLASSFAEDYDTLLIRAETFAQSFGEKHDGWFLYVDEFQDSAPIDLRIYDRLRCVKRWYVGDPDQCIFEFRGASIDNIMGVSARPQWTTHYLEENYRSETEIVEESQSLIQQNHIRLWSSPRAVKTGMGRVLVTRFFTAEEEIAAIISELRQCRPGEGTWGILTRYNATRAEIENALKSAGMDVGAPPPDRPHDHRLGMAVLAVMANPDSRLANHSWIRAAYPAKIAQGMIERGASGTLVKDWPDSFETFDQLATTLHRQHLSRGFLELVHAAHKASASLDPSILSTCIVPSATAAPAQFRVMTMHAAKGLEFDNVWIAGADIATSIAADNLEPERRLFYVAMTRARTKLVVSSSLSRVNQYTRKAEERMLSPFLPTRR